MRSDEWKLIGNEKFSWCELAPDSRNISNLKPSISLGFKNEDEKMDWRKRKESVLFSLWQCGSMAATGFLLNYIKNTLFEGQMKKRKKNLTHTSRFACGAAGYRAHTEFLSGGWKEKIRDEKEAVEDEALYRSEVQWDLQEVQTQTHQWAC